MKNLLIVHGPNLNLLGEREPDKYGTQTLDEINKSVTGHAETYGIKCRFFQSNHEGELIDTLQKESSWFDGLIINPGALSHTSIALRDTISALTCPVAEVHLTNIHSREDFRRFSFISAVSTGVIYGFGAKGYLLAVDALAK